MIHIGGNKMPSEGNEQRACSALMCFWFACICISLLAVVIVACWLLLLLVGCCCCWLLRESILKASIRRTAALRELKSRNNNFSFEG